MVSTSFLEHWEWKCKENARLPWLSCSSTCSKLIIYTVKMPRIYLVTYLRFSHTKSFLGRLRSRPPAPPAVLEGGGEMMEGGVAHISGRAADRERGPPLTPPSTPWEGKLIKLSGKQNRVLRSLETWEISIGSRNRWQKIGQTQKLVGEENGICIINWGRKHGYLSFSLELAAVRWARTGRLERVIPSGAHGFERWNYRGGVEE